MPDTMNASALKKLLNTQIHSRKRVSVEEQRAQKSDGFLRGKQITYMICEHFRATGACEAVQELSDLFTTSLQKDDVQDFDVKWDQAPLSMIRCDPGRIAQVKTAGFCSASECIVFERSISTWKNGQPNYSRLKTVEKSY